MDFQLTEDFVKENGLTEEQVKAVSTFVSTDYIPTIKKDWDGKANENAEGIITGAAKYAATKLGVELERYKGEKLGDYLQRLSDTGLSKKEQALKVKEAELEEKLKNFKGGDEYKTQLETLRQEKDNLLKQVAELEPLKGLDEKYREATEKLSGLKLNVAFNNIKPTFPTEVNTYEAKAKWETFQKGVLEKYNIELVDNEAVAIDKENHHKTIKLSDLLSQDNDIKELLSGRQQQGTGAQPANLKDVEGVPFKVPENASSEDRSKLIREYLASKGVVNTSPEYAKQFSDLNLKIAKAKQAA